MLADTRSSDLLIRAGRDTLAAYDAPGLSRCAKGSTMPTPAGLQLARELWQAVSPLLHAKAPNIMDHAAVGLVGEGSECLGCDDELSRDHDFGPAFCLWLPQAVLTARRPDVEALMALLPEHFNGFAVRMSPAACGGRVGPLAIETFYRRFIGLPRAPETWQEWLTIPETSLAVATNGEVFEDKAGTFTEIREKLLAFYPEDVRRKKIAARCMIMAQAGQYNLPRCLKRGETIAVLLAKARFAEAAISMAFLLNRRYMPFYKWAGRCVANLPVLGRECAALLAQLPDSDGIDAVETLCEAVARELRAQNLSSEADTWLWAHGPQVQRGISQTEIRAMSVLADGCTP